MRGLPQEVALPRDFFGGIFLVLCKGVRTVQEASRRDRPAAMVIYD